MHVEDFPLTIGLVVAIGHTESGFLLDSGIIRLGEVLKAVGHGHRAVGFDLQIDEITF